jgi:uncharacterized membrane protein HdeD (DUF308 family)
VLAISIALIATLAVTIFLGWLFLISGLVGLVTTFWARHAPGFWWSLLSAVLAIATGVGVLGWRVPGVLMVFFIIEGVLSIMYALAHKKKLSARWRWILLSGIVDLCLAAITAALVSPSGWQWLAVLVSIDMLFGGAVMIAIAGAPQQRRRTHQNPPKGGNGNNAISTSR